MRAHGDSISMARIVPRSESRSEQVFWLTAQSLASAVNDRTAAHEPFPFAMGARSLGATRLVAPSVLMFDDVWWVER